MDQNYEIPTPVTVYYAKDSTCSKGTNCACVDCLATQCACKSGYHTYSKDSYFTCVIPTHDPTAAPTSGNHDPTVAPTSEKGSGSHNNHSEAKDKDHTLMIILVVGGTLTLLLAAAGAYWWWARKSIDKAHAGTEANVRTSAGLGAAVGDVEMDIIPKFTGNPMHTASRPRGTAVLDTSPPCPEGVGASIEGIDVKARVMTAEPALGVSGGHNDSFSGQAHL